MSALLVVAGEASGDAWAADVVRRLRTHTIGIGGAHLSKAGLELSADLSEFSAMGISGVARRAPAVLRAALRVRRAVAECRPRAALLVGFSELNARLSPWLRAHGVKVVWYAPPQVWAWRPGRARSIARNADALAVVLPFEQTLWRDAGARADYVGHPALEHAPAQESLEAAPDVVVLPGSRAHEVRAHLPALLGATRALRRTGDVERAVVVVAPSLDSSTRAFTRRAALEAGVMPVETSLQSAGVGARIALSASGTATVECAVLGVPPIIVYRTDVLTYAVARRLVKVRQIGLPNLVLGRAAFPELVQAAVKGERIADAARDVLARHPARLRDCAEVRERLATPVGADAPSERVAQMLAPWLS